MKPASGLAQDCAPSFAVMKSDDTQSGKDARVAQVIEEVIRRRGSAQRVLEGDVIGAHSDLMPELGDKLRALRRVELAEQRAGSSMTEGDIAETTAMSAGASALLPFDSFHGYKLIEEIYRGGQGVVYRAVQKGTRRDVAIKVMRDGPFLGPRDIARFDREVRILARLKHPNIVTIHDSGSAAGHHFFVMDHIAGKPLDEHLAGRQWSVDRALRLFVKICRAVNAAHLHGIIHRDLKPGNILIDQRGEPQILDFGLAKMATEEIDDAAQWRNMTMTGQFVGSLPWASPEQADGSLGKIDLRTDVYSLGVILYHMLTGRFPYKVEGNVQDVLRRILGVEPLRPSSIRKEIDEDVETIICKCLAKEPDRRYQNAAAVADDVDRSLANQPIMARAPSTMYQFKKLIRRHRLPFSLLMTLMLLLTTTAIWMSVLYGREKRQHDRTLLAEQRAERRRVEAEYSSQKAQAINDFLINDMLASADPGNAQGRKITVEEVLANAARRIENTFADQPIIEASVRDTIGKTYMSLGIYDEAAEHLRIAEAIRTRELGDDHPETLQSRIRLADLLCKRGDLAEAATLADSTWVACRRVLGDDHPDTLRAEFLQAVIAWHRGDIATAVERHREVLEKRRRLLGDDHPDTLDSINEWTGQVLWSGANVAGAEELLRNALEDSRRVLGPQHPESFKAMTGLGTALTDKREFETAEPMLREAYSGLRRVLGPRHPDTLLTMVKLASLLKEMDEIAEATDLFHEACELSQDALGEAHPVTVLALESWASSLLRRGSYLQSAEAYRIAYRSISGRYGEEDARSAHALSGEAHALAELGQSAEAESLLRRAIPVLRRIVGDEHVNTVWALRCFVKVLAAQGKIEEARPLAVELLEARRRQATAPDASAYQLNCYARALLDIVPKDLRDPKLALEVALQAYAKSTDAYHYNRYTLALAYEANGEHDKAIEMLQRALARMPIDDSTERSDYEAALARLLEEAGSSGPTELVGVDAPD